MVYKNKYVSCTRIHTSTITLLHSTYNTVILGQHDDATQIYNNYPHGSLRQPTMILFTGWSQQVLFWEMIPIIKALASFWRLVVGCSMVFQIISVMTFSTKIYNKIMQYKSQIKWNYHMYFDLSTNSFSYFLLKFPSLLSPICGPHLWARNTDQVPQTTFTNWLQNFIQIQIQFALFRYFELGDQSPNPRLLCKLFFALCTSFFFKWKIIQSHWGKNDFMLIAFFVSTISCLLILLCGTINNWWPLNIDQNSNIQLLNYSKTHRPSTKLFLRLLHVNIWMVTGRSPLTLEILWKEIQLTPHDKLRRKKIDWLLHSHSIMMT